MGLVTTQKGRMAIRPYDRLREQLVRLFGGIKSAATKLINELRQTPGVKLWQRNYYDHIIRNEKPYLEIFEYITNNPLYWNEDKFNNEIH